MSNGICPVGCESCPDPECYVSGCRLAGVSILHACEQCGMLHVMFLEPPICEACWRSLDEPSKRKG